MSRPGDGATAGDGLEARVFAIERPDPVLLRYYALACVLAGPFFPFVFAPLYFRFRTMRYRFDREGVSMRWGVLFRKEINLTYARIQDIHLSSNVMERWLGLARIEIQTASASAKAEMTIEGVLGYDELRDYLYSRMRGTREPARAGEGGDAPGPRAPAASGGAGPAAEAELAAVLREVAAELRGVRHDLETGRSAGGLDG